MKLKAIQREFNYNKFGISVKTHVIVGSWDSFFSSDFDTESHKCIENSFVFFEKVLQILAFFDIRIGILPFKKYSCEF